MKNVSFKLILIIVAIVVSAALLLTFMVQGVQNRAISLEEQIDSAKSAVSVQEKRRADLIPNLVDCVQAYSQHEYNTLMDVVAQRGTDTDAAAAEIQTMINAVAEAYPELKSDVHYRELMLELTTTENHIADYRESYNNWVKRYNQYVRKFPNRMFLEFLGYEVVPFQSIDYGSQYEDAPANLFGE